MKKILLNLLFAPIWFLGLFTSAKSFRDNPVIGSELLNQKGLHYWRVKLANWFAIYRRFFLKKHVSKDKQAEYAVNGFIRHDNFLSKDVFQSLKNEVFGLNWPLREMRQGGTVTRRVFLNAAELQDCAPTLAAFISNSELIAQLRYVAGVGGEPIFSIQAIFSEANTRSDPQMVVHADTFHANAKAWLFLEDVGENDGPFSYVAGSHLVTNERLVWEKKQSIGAKKHAIPYHAKGSFRAFDADLQEMKLNKPQKAIVGANTLVIADTFGFHSRSSSHLATCRFEIYATLRRNPFLPWVGLDLFSFPYIKERSGNISIFLLSMFSKVGLRKMPWKPVGVGKVKDAVRI